MLTATLPVVLTQNNTVGLTQRSAAERAVNQLLSVVVGKYSARTTDHLKTDVSSRIQACLEIASQEYQDALKTLATNPDASRQVQQCQRKLDSLGSLQVMANLINETEW